MTPSIQRSENTNCRYDHNTRIANSWLISPRKVTHATIKNSFILGFVSGSSEKRALVGDDNVMMKVMRRRRYSDDEGNDSDKEK